ncbi:DUF4221 family protein [Roseivirga misakiensis]|uniref:DUF4221 domain-containing protein n=1 Tax=Roseivirga misakiensis TaxID=1563681 RepID=A0A1E5T3A5_9BACT|nr:DUF4221 family protein [Roseivirga misakiensis]OEK05821.1 hypothetical protein BFP71_06795 [Roseivirga misakiensis]
MNAAKSRISFLGLVFLLLASIFSCSNKKSDGAIATETDQPEEEVQLKIVDGGIVTLKLDLEANFQLLQQLRGINLNNKDLVTFYSRNAHAIYLYDAVTGELVKKTEMDKEGPNAVQTQFVFSYFYHTMDSIFFNGLPFGIYLIDSNGEVLQKKKLGNKDEIPRFDSPKPNFDFASTYNNGEISLPTEFILYQVKSKERVIFDFENDRLEDEFLASELIFSDYDEVKRVKTERSKQGKLTMNNKRFFSKNDQYLFASHLISDTIYAFRDGELVKRIYAGVPDIEVADYASYANVRSIERFKNGMQAIENPKQDPQFKNTLMSPDGKFIYRVLYHETKPKIVEGSDRPKPEVTGATLIVLDLETEELIYYDLPVAELELGIPMNRHVFVTNRGIHFRVLDQDNEDEVQFRLFQLNR